jgi:hypothetical protein
MEEFVSIYHLFGNDLIEFLDCEIIKEKIYEHGNGMY